MAQVVLLTDVTPSGDDPIYGRAIGAYVLASKARRAGFSAVVIDRFLQLENLDSILNSAIDSETIFVGISGTFLSNKERSETFHDPQSKFSYESGYLWSHDFETLEHFVRNIRTVLKTKQNDTTVPVVLGGTKALFALQNDKVRPLFDFYAVGKGESFFVEMLQQLVRRGPLPFRIHKDGSYLHESCFQKSTDTIESMLWNQSDAITQSSALPIEISKGCLYNCKFCYYEKQASLRQTTTALKTELIRNYEMFGTTFYQFCDDCFNDTRPKVEEICNAILSMPFKIEWISYARVDVACKFPHTLDLMIESGSRGLLWGLETFNHKIGRTIGKGTDPALTKQMLIDTRAKHGDRCILMGSFIVGLHGETENSIRETFDWIIESKTLDLVYSPILTIHPYSERLDKAIIDFADYSRNPEKYGFKYISFSPHEDWEHQTMNRARAFDVRNEQVSRHRAAGISNSFITTVFQYPQLRELGMTHDEIVHAIRNERRGGSVHREVLNRQRNAILKYETQLLGTLKAARRQIPLTERLQF